MIQGVDRSHLNEKVSLASLVDKGVKFIFFKATQADTFVDPTFNSAWQQAKGIPELARGCYHFFDPRIDGIVQAKHYLSTGVNFSGVGCLMPCVDVEDLTGPDSTEANQWVADHWQIAVKGLNDFLGHIKDKTGRDCIIYSYNGYMREYLHYTSFPNNPMWLSSLQANCPNRYDTGKMPEFWQNTYGWNGTDMDGDFFTGAQQQLNALANIV